MLATFYFLTLYMQVIKGWSPMETGLAYMPFALGMGLSAGAGPQLLAKLSQRATTAAGLVLSIAGMAWFTQLAPAQNAWTVLMPAQLVAGIGLGMVFVTATIAGVQGVPDRETGIASGLVNTSLQIGGAIGLAALSAIAIEVTKGKLPGSAPAALTDGYTTGMAIGGALYAAALLAAVLTLPRAGQQSEAAT
jgi:MFS family permease